MSSTQEVTLVANGGIDRHQNAGIQTPHQGAVSREHIEQNEWNAATGNSANSR
jgi:hypothetical protein